MACDVDPEFNINESTMYMKKDVFWKMCGKPNSTFPVDSMVQ